MTTAHDDSISRRSAVALAAALAATVATAVVAYGGLLHWQAQAAAHPAPAPAAHTTQYLQEEAD